MCRHRTRSWWLRPAAARWHNGHARITIRAFLQWCMTGKLTGRFRLPPTVISHAAALPGHERVSQLGRILTAHDLPLRTRVAAAIVLLYAQPSAASSASPSMT